LTEYATRIGRNQGNVSRYRQAAEVFTSLETRVSPHGFLDKAEHLALIHQTDRENWPVLVDRMIEEKWNAEDTKTAVDAIRGGGAASRIAACRPRAKVAGECGAFQQAVSVKQADQGGMRLASRPLEAAPAPPPITCPPVSSPIRARC
jgi:hypothetical protein